MIRNPNRSLVANPVLVGAVTVLITIVAVHLAYVANTGLPFVPTRTLTVDLPDGQNLVPQNEVREGGFRIGLVTEMTPVQLDNGRLGARLTLELDQQVPAVPRDSRFAVRPRSSLSLKYLELERGVSERTVPEDGNVPVERANSPVELDRLLQTFDAPTRVGNQQVYKGLAGSLIGRGTGINETIALLPEFFRRLEPVSRTLADPDTGLRTFFRELGDAARIVAPVASEYAESFTDGATTFEALSRDEQALEQTIARTPPTLAVGERSLRAQRPFQRDLTGLSIDLERTSRQVRLAVGPVNRALAVGTPVQRRSVALNDRVRGTLVALSELSRDLRTNTGLRGLTALTETLNPQFRYQGPRITVCNYWNFFWTFNAEHLSERDPTGTSERVLGNSGDGQDNSVTSMDAVAPANGENVAPGGIPQFYHGQPYGRAVDEQGNADCEDANRGYPEGPLTKNVTNPEDRARFDRIVSDARTPGNQGPVFDQLVDGEGVGLGPARVPEGQTFSAEPETGAQIP